MNWFPLIGLFAKPLGAAINNALSAGAAAVGTWAVSKGADAGWVVPTISAVVFAISQTISGLAATQGVQIPVINADPTNGVRVVDAQAAREAGLPKADAPKT